jgi:hypothetical protein
MVVIRVPKTPASASNPDRPISSLLRNQIEHLQEAEFRLPVRDQTNIYVNKIKTEGEAAEYIRQVTAKLHSEATPRKKTRQGGKSTSPRFTIAAVGQRKTKPKAKAKTAAKRKRTTKHKPARRGR